MPTQNPQTGKKRRPGKKAPVSPDNLVANKKNQIELTEDDLKGVSGGSKLDYKE